MTLFSRVVKEAVSEYEYCFGSIPQTWKDRIAADLQQLREAAPDQLEDLSYDTRLDGNGLAGVVRVTRVFTEKVAVYDAFQSEVDELNTGNSWDDEEKQKVFGGGLFPEQPGYELEPLFK